MTAHSRAVISLTLVCALVACRSTPNAADTEPFSTDLADITLIFSSEESAELEVALALVNHRSTPLRVTRFDWQLHLDRTWFASGTQAMSLDVDASSQLRAPLTIPIRFTRVPLEPSTRTVAVKLSGTLEAVSGSEKVRGDFDITRQRKLDRVPALEDLGTE